MKIAQVAPLCESVPPKTYGGTERVVHYLTEALVQQGHDVTLFASADSCTSAKLQAIVPEALRLASEKRDIFHQPWQLLQLAQVSSAAESFDIIHFHTDFAHFPLLRKFQTPHVTTLHGRLDCPDFKPLFDEFLDIPVISIANHQRDPLPMAYWTDTVYNGIPVDLYDFQADGGEYLAFLGRMSPEKGAEEAIEIALRAEMPLKMAAKIDVVDREYFETRIRPHLNHPLIEFIGEVDERGKNELLGGAKALIFPIAWPEPFGLVMIEAMACGTPVIAYRRGSVPEVMIDGVTGYVVESKEEAASAIARIDRIDRGVCRSYFEERFSAERMAKNYVNAYQKLMVQQENTRSDSGAYLIDMRKNRKISPSDAWKQRLITASTGTSDKL